LSRDQQSGVEVAEPESGGPADRAGIRAGDVVVSLDEDLVLGMASLQAALSPERIDQEVSVEIVRRDERMEIAIRLGVWPAK
jgi:serine protease DegQ